jgi:FkbM family methyltransferase
MSGAFTIGRWLMRVRPAPLASFLKSVVRVRRVEQPTPEGTFWLDPASQFGQALHQDGTYDPETLALLKQLLRPGDTFVDVGANEGYFSVVASRLVGPGGRVVAVEPQARLQPVLARNFQLNACAAATVVPVAISDAPGTRPLLISPDMNSGATGFARRTRYRLPTQATACLTLEQLCAQERLGAGVVMKMDIEGWEREALLGSPELLRSGRIRALVLELHPEHLRERGRSADEVTDFLATAGYRRLSALGWQHASAR